MWLASLQISQPGHGYQYSMAAASVASSGYGGSSAARNLNGGAESGINGEK